MSEQKLDLDRDLREARSMAAQLEPYVMEQALYGTLPGGGNQPALTIGALLLRLRRLRALASSLSPAQQQLLAEVEAQHEQTHREWRVHYDEKRLREANSRLDAMRAYFEECSQNERLCASAYLPEAMRRSIVQEIVIAISGDGVLPDELAEKMRGIDGRLRRFIKPTPFIWAESLSFVYPQDVFWWLYARPPYPDQR